MAGYDVAIVGAGPAGALTALMLRQLRPQANVLLLEAEPWPRPRPCGEFLAPHGVEVLERAGLLDAVRGAAMPLSGLRLIGAAGQILSRFPEPGAFGVRRERLDGILQEAAASAGAELRRGAPLRALWRASEAWRVDSGTGIDHATVVVGADGRHSRVRRVAGLDAPSPRRRYALGPLGQLGLAPLGGDEANLNLLLSEASRPLLKQLGPPKLLRAAIASTPNLRARLPRLELGPVLATGPLAQMSRAPTADGIALVGDAAGAWDPFTGDGISVALRGAELLAHRLAEGATDERLANYARDWRQLVARKRRADPLLAAGLARRRVAESVLALLSAMPGLGRLAMAYAAAS
jgi:flavin-dependent dehydrogenase